MLPLTIPTRRREMDSREAAEAIEQFGDELAKLTRTFNNTCARMRSDHVDRVNAIDFQDKLDTIAEAFRALGDQMLRECDAEEEAEDRRCMVNVGGHRDGGSAA